MNEFVAALHDFGVAFTSMTHLDVMSILIGMFFASLFELPLLGKLRRK